MSISQNTIDLIAAVHAAALFDDAVVDKVLMLGRSLCCDIERQADVLAGNQTFKAKQIRTQARVCIEVIDARFEEFPPPR